MTSPEMYPEPSPVTQASQDATAALDKPLKVSQGLSFPSNLGSRAVFFQVKTRNRAKQRDPANHLDGSVVGLPIPANLSTGYGAVYSQQGLGVLGAKAESIIEGNQTLQQNLADIRETGISTILEQAKAIAASASPEAAALLGGVAGGGIGTAGVTAALAGIGVGALRGAGLAVNPHLAVLFEGMNFRNHTFNYKFAARDAGESSTLKSIIDIFKIAMHPTSDGGAFFQYPDEFLITFPSDQFLFKIGTSVLTSFTVDYTPDGGSYFHVNGAPVSVAMSLQFTELDILTKTEIGEGR